MNHKYRHNTRDFPDFILNNIKEEIMENGLVVDGVSDLHDSIIMKHIEFWPHPIDYDGKLSIHGVPNWREIYDPVYEYCDEEDWSNRSMYFTGKFKKVEEA